MKTKGKMALLARTLTGMYATVRYPLQTLHGGWQIYWSRKMTPQLPVVDRVGADVVSLDAYCTFDIPSRHMDWDIPIYDLYWLTRLVNSERPRRIMEFGTFTGLTTLYLAKHSPDDAIVTTIDLPDEEFRRIRPSSDVEVGMRFRGTMHERKIRRVAADLAEFRPDDHELQDFIFVDAMHFYEDVCRDTDNALRLLKPGGMLVWHDYNVSESGAGVVRCLNGLNQRMPGVCQIKGTNLAFYKKPAETHVEG